MHIQRSNVSILFLENYPLINSMRLHHLKFGWWNVSLSPPRSKSKGNPENYQTVCNVLIDTLTTHELSVLAICEVSSADVNEIERCLEGTPFKIQSFDHDVGQTRYDTAVIYNSLSVEISHIEDLKRFPRDQVIKIGQVIQVVDLKEKDIFKLVLCHWPSRVNTSGESRRYLAAEGLYHATSDMMRNNEHIIVMGDFNSSPYDRELLEGLKATRCHEAVRKHPTELFYNPFWRALSPKEIYNYTMKDKEHFPSGSHRYKDPYGEYWHTFDQIIFSGNFIGSSVWHLNESTATALSTDLLISSILDKSSIIDHLPVVCEIIKHP